MNNNKKGLSIVEIVIVIVVFGLVVAVGWLIYERQTNKSSDTPLTGANSTQQIEESNKEINSAKDQYVNWETANFELVQASFKYPKYLVLTKEINANADPNSAFETYTLTANDNSKITLYSYVFFGGFTGDEPKYMIDDVITGLDKTNNREFSSIIYKNSNGVYDNAYVMDSTQTKYNAGQESQIFLNSFGVKPKGGNTEPSQLSIIISGKDSQTFNTLEEFKSIEAYKDIRDFLNALNIPANQ
ncbi:MAG: prepilin-type N-terminal cleavage/methylation domain-containing protein [Patescibacteria group bacterium]|jgi:Tfp pilus assembly protein PilE|nr:prepilin-type N-terminal cleavage/methylation domain-containing protein [Patescibacteria group bacterium]